MAYSKVDITDANWADDIDRTKEYKVYKGQSLLGRLIPEESFATRSVKEIIESPNKYFVPAYQRGYRWQKQQVIELLDDISSWGNSSENKEKKYCLQPIVIAASEKEGYNFDLVDGQQRLTTIFLILKAIGKSVEYSIEYQTRPKSTKYLNSLDELESIDNIDYYHMYQTYEVAKAYFKDEESQKNWYDKLVNDKNGAFFIEYNILPGVDDRSVEQIFTGLNAGKIPLTNSELVKALILRENNFDKATYKNEFVEIAQEWDRIEKRLRETNFWAWLGEKPTDNPHIDFVLDMVAKELNKTRNLGVDEKDQNYSYNVLSRALENDDLTCRASILWKEIKKCFMTLEDWYDDIETYHLVGYLNQIDKSNKVSSFYERYFAEDFSFNDEVGKKFINVDFEDINFGNPDLYRILLIFNILSCIKNKTKFHFDLYSGTKYDVEHIFPHSEFDRLQTEKERKEWLNSAAKSGLFASAEFTIDERIMRFSDLDTETFDYEQFNDLYEQIIRYGITDESQVVSKPDRLGNLCLLDSKTNRGYGNKPFPNKVKEITEVDAKQTQYVLPCTKNVFLKYYSGLNINNYIWTENDAEKYESTIINDVKTFFAISEVGLDDK